MNKTLKKRIRFLAKPRSCYGCLKPMTEGDNAKTCTQRSTCSSCKGNYPTPLHGSTPNKKSKADDGNQTVDGEGNLKSNFAGFNNDLKCASMTGKTGYKIISMCIVSVKMKHGDGKDMITTYVMLDNSSQGSFFHDNLVKELGVHGMKTTFNLKTLHGEKTESPIIVKEIKVTGMSGDGSLLSLPKLSRRKEIPVDKKEIGNPAKTKERKHLRSIKNEIVQRDDVQVGLLIGANCIQALEPTKIVQSEGGGPYAYKTWLGWCVVGPINCISKGITTSCNRVAVRDVASSKLASHHFTMEKSVKDVSLEEMFQAM